MGCARRLVISLGRAGKEMGLAGGVSHLALLFPSSTKLQDNSVVHVVLNLSGIAISSKWFSWERLCYLSK